jgi:hypothetical protein
VPGDRQDDRRAVERPALRPAELEDEHVVRIEVGAEPLRLRRGDIDVRPARGAELGVHRRAQVGQRRVVVVDPVEDHRRPLRVEPVHLGRIDRARGIGEVLHRHRAAGVDDEHLGRPEIAVSQQPVDIVERQQVAEVGFTSTIDIQPLRLEVLVEEGGTRNRMDQALESQGVVHDGALPGVLVTVDRAGRRQ